jgi:hypothetical protein
MFIDQYRQYYSYVITILFDLKFFKNNKYIKILKNKFIINILK